MTAFMVSAWFATIVADRIDLLRGQGSFLLTPFLVLSPLLLVSTAWHFRTRSIRVRLPRSFWLYCLLATALLIVVLVSVFFSLDILIAAKRYVLIAYEVYITLAIAVVLRNLPSAKRALVVGSYAGLLLALLFNIGELVAWLAAGGTPAYWFAGVLDLTPNTYGPWLPRLSGQVLDMNRAGILFLVYLFVIRHFGTPSRTRSFFIGLAWVFAVLTLSRSVLLAGLTMWGVTALQQRKIRLRPRRVLVALLLASLVGTWILSSSRRVEATATMLEFASRRFDAKEGSASMHLQLIGRGWEIATDRVENALIGVGFGNSFLYVQDFYPGNKYGNFHSAYITMLAEGGVFALVLFLFIAFAPAISPVNTPLLLGFGAFNIFYQLVLEPVFWFAVAATWLGLFDSFRWEDDQSDSYSGGAGATTIAAHHT